jgi:hypothetical protein
LAERNIGYDNCFRSKFFAGYKCAFKVAQKDFVVLRHKGKSFFALIRLDESDWETLSLSQNSDFMAMLDKARARFDAKGGLSLEEAKQRFAKRRRHSSSHKKTGSKVAKAGIDENIGSKVAISVQHANERYAMLIDKKFKQVLTKEEQLELDALKIWLDEAEKPFYENIIQRLAAERDNLLKNLTKNRRRVGR